LAQQFVTIARSRQQEQLDPWLKACLSSDIPDLRIFADGLLRVISAIKATFTQPVRNPHGLGEGCNANISPSRKPSPIHTALVKFTKSDPLKTISCAYATFTWRLFLLVFGSTGQFSCES